MPQRIGFVLLTHANTPQVRRLIGTLDRMFDAPPIVCHRKPPANPSSPGPLAR